MRRPLSPFRSAASGVSKKVLVSRCSPAGEARRAMSRSRMAARSGTFIFASISVPILFHHKTHQFPGNINPLNNRLAFQKWLDAFIIAHLRKNFLLHGGGGDGDAAAEFAVDLEG